MLRSYWWAIDERLKSYRKVRNSLHTEQNIIRKVYYIKHDDDMTTSLRLSKRKIVAGPLAPCRNVMAASVHSRHWSKVNLEEGIQNWDPYRCINSQSLAEGALGKGDARGIICKVMQSWCTSGVRLCADYWRDGHSMTRCDAYKAGPPYGRACCDKCWSGREHFIRSTVI